MHPHCRARPITPLVVRAPAARTLNPSVAAYKAPGRRPNPRTPGFSSPFPLPPLPRVSVFYRRVCLGIPLGGEMIVGSRRDQGDDGTSNTSFRKVRAADIV